ncbi:ABC transporter ATP-binding protein [Clostridium sp. Ade.TY]|uniref:ABC transporter ATP-binding protein n=1 Tax=Clostridium sp. Ade.TY TaxID=1391647 RepID=UPI0004111ACE|nr:ABC transporter ATP-binding protein [Clostridium sp. Ade.TY]
MINSNNIDNLIEVKNLKKYFLVRNKFFSRSKLYNKAIDDISFSIKKGKILGLVGESGCGKSTTGKAILNLIEPTGGSVKFNNKVIFDVDKNIKLSKKELSSIRKDMQIIFQDPYGSLDPKMTIKNIVSEGIKKHKIIPPSEIENRCIELLSLCGMDKSCLNKYPHEFSGGQRQRICIARALSLNPQFIVCDEPTAALDVSIQSQILNLMLDLKENFSLTYLFISHNLSVVMNFCDDISVMYLGIIVESAPTNELRANPLHPYTKVLISSMPISHPLEKKHRILLKGSIPNGTNIPNGCRFHTRCPYCMEICKVKSPKYKEISPNHSVACHLF